jgi:hypothetical protein
VAARTPTVGSASPPFEEPESEAAKAAPGLLQSPAAQAAQDFRELLAQGWPFLREVKSSEKLKPCDIPARPRPRPRPRGAGRPAVRGASRRSSARSGDSGEDGESSEGSSEPPPGGRLCLCGCGVDLDRIGKNSDARYFKDACRKRAQRVRDEAKPERVVERAVKRHLKLRIAGALDGVKTCGCKPKGVFRYCDPEGDVVCFACGRPRRGYRLGEANGYDEAERVMQQLDRLSGRIDRAIKRKTA